MALKAQGSAYPVLEKFLDYRDGRSPSGPDGLREKSRTAGPWLFRLLRRRMTDRRLLPTTADGRVARTCT